MTYNYPSVRLILPEETILPEKNVLNRPICDEINKSALSRVPHVTYTIPRGKQVDFPLYNQSFEKHNVSNTLYL